MAREGNTRAPASARPSDAARGHVVAQSRTPPERDTVETFLGKEMKERHIPGMQVAVVQHGKVVLMRAYGLADVQHSVPVTTKTPFSDCVHDKSFYGCGNHAAG